MAIKLIAFDVFGTVFDLSGVPRQEIRDYAAHIRQPEWSPLVLPKSWEVLPAYPDSPSGIALLRSLGFMVVTMSNGPLGLLAKLSKHNRVSWDAITPLEMRRVYKPNPTAYMMLCDVYDVKPAEVLMVTANEKFGDLEAAEALGMNTAWIRTNPAGPKTIIEFADGLSKLTEAN